jgi:hypothetical protein
MSATLQFPQAIEDALTGLNPSVSRRDFLRSSGALVLTLGVDGVPGSRALAQAVDAGPYPDRDFRELDTWIVIHPDNTATFFVGKTDGGQGTGTAFRQLMCDELDIAYDKTSLVMGSTDITPDQGGSGGSDAIDGVSCSVRVDRHPAERGHCVWRDAVPVAEVALRMAHDALRVEIVTHDLAQGAERAPRERDTRL